MKYLIFIFSFLVFGCTTIYFPEAQPAKTKELESFPPSFLGSYIMDPDTFIIEERSYSFPVVYENSYALSDIDTNPDYEIRDEFFYDKTIMFDEGLPYNIENDTLHYRKHIRGSKFISDTLKIKKYKNYLIISEKSNENAYWTVMLLKEKGRNFILGMNGRFKTAEDTGSVSNYDGSIEHFKHICEFEELGKNTFLAKPSKKEFGKLVNEGFFSVEIEMIRIEKE